MSLLAGSFVLAFVGSSNYSNKGIIKCYAVARLKGQIRLCGRRRGRCSHHKQNKQHRSTSRTDIGILSIATPVTGNMDQVPRDVSLLFAPQGQISIYNGGSQPDQLPC